MSKKAIWMAREKLTPKEGEVYQNINGGVFRCLSSDPEHLSGDTTMQSVVSGWTFRAHGCGIYPSGNIDWDRSSDGRFEKRR